MHDQDDGDVPPLPPRESDGVAAVFDQAYKTYLNPVCRYIAAQVDSWEIAEELVNDVFHRLWLALDAGETIHHLPAYLYAAARRRAIDYRRRRHVEVRHRDQQASLALWPEQRIVSPEVEQRLASDELTAELVRAIDALPARQREVVLLKWRRQASQDEIARELGISTKTVTEHFRRALRQLRTTLGDLIRLR